MNNLNDPDWNIRPEQPGGDYSSKWNYALLVPLLGLAAFRWIWSKESQAEIRAAKAKYEQSVKVVRDDLELKYRQTLSEDRREMVRLELQLERERQRAQGYRLALASQGQQLQEERRGLRREREGLDAERARLLRAGPAGALFHEALEREDERERGAAAVLAEVEDGLAERQRAFCSFLVPREKRLELERELLVRAAKAPVLARLDVEGGLRDIFKNDRSCAEYLNTDKRRNGSLMWVYLRYWQLQATLEKHQRAEASLLGPQSNK